MCLEKPMLPDGTVIACRKCRLCRDNAVNDWVGRCIAESKSASVSYCFTLTYGRDQDESSPFYGLEDHPRAKVLTYSDVQKLFKLLRRHKYKFSYFVVGEYGSTKGRSHWHVVLFFYGPAPALAGHNSFGTWSDRHLSRGFDDKDKVRFMWQRLDKFGQPVFVKGKPAYWWPHGWVEVSEASHAGIRYNTKYIQKDIGKMERQGHLMPSKKPPLGHRYFMEQAELMVRQGVALRDLFYTFDEARTDKGELIRFRLKPPQFNSEGEFIGGRVAHDFISHYVSTWKRERPGRFLPESELLDDWHDKQSVAIAREERELMEWRDKYLEEHADDERACDRARAAYKRGERLPDEPKRHYKDDDEWLTHFRLQHQHDPEAIERVEQWLERKHEDSEDWQFMLNRPLESLDGMSINQWDEIHGKGSYFAFFREAEAIEYARDRPRRREAIRKVREDAGLGESRDHADSWAKPDGNAR